MSSAERQRAHRERAATARNKMRAAVSAANARAKETKAALRGAAATSSAAVAQLASAALAGAAAGAEAPERLHAEAAAAAAAAADAKSETQARAAFDKATGRAVEPAVSAALSSLARDKVKHVPACCSEELFARLASRLRLDLDRGAAADARIAYLRAAAGPRRLCADALHRARAHFRREGEGCARRLPRRRRRARLPETLRAHHPRLLRHVDVRRRDLQAAGRPRRRAQPTLHRRCPL